MTTILIIIGYFIFWIALAILMRKCSYYEQSWGMEEPILCGMVWPLFIPSMILLIFINAILMIIDKIHKHKNTKI